MEHDIQTWSFGDPTGWTIACALFFLWAGMVGLGVYGISYRLVSMGSLDQEQRASRTTSVVLGAFVALVIFFAFYLTTLSGFSQLALRDDQLTVRYILPERSMVLSFSEVMNVQEEQAYKGLWRLVLTTETSGTYESVLASRTEVRKAGDFLKRRMTQPYSLHR